jgi:hypothetical protein
MNVKAVNNLLTRTEHEFEKKKEVTGKTTD